MLEIEGLGKKFDRFCALSELSLKVDRGSLFGLVGPNGAGKTTLIKIVVGLIFPDEGKIKIDGTDPLRHPQKAKKIMGYVPDHFGVYENLKVMEYMIFFAECCGIYGMKGRKRCRELLGQVGLDGKENMMVDSLSRGMKQSLCLARALINNPKFIVMDEPTSGLDPGTRYKFKEILRELNGQGKTILVSSHILSELSEVCTDIGVIENGSMKLTGRVADILDRIKNSNPLKITVLNGVKTAMGIFRRNPCVRTVSLDDNTFVLNFDGTREDEAVLLQQLIDSDIPVNGFIREPGNLESFFMQMTEHIEEKVVLNSEDESDI